MATDTTVNNLIINVLSKEQYDNIAQKSATELYLVPDDTETVKSVSVNGSTYTPDSTGDVDLGTISGGSGGEANVIESVKVNGTALTVTNKAVDISAVTSFNGSTGAVTYTAPVTSVNGSTGAVTLTLGDANVIETVKVNGTALTPTNKAVDITSIPASIVTQDATHRFVSDTEKSTWNNKANSSDLNNYVLATNGTHKGKLIFQDSAGHTSDNYIQVTYNDVDQLSTASAHFAGGTFTFDDWYGGSSMQTQISGGKLITNRTITCVGLESGNSSNLSTTNVWNTDGSFTDISGFITSSDIPTLSKGTTSGSGNAVTDISVSGHTITLTKGSTFLTSETSLSKGTTTGSGNAVTDISVSGHTITLTKGSTFLTSHQNIKTLNGYTITGTGSVDLDSEDIDYVPTLGASLTYLDSPGIMNTSEALEILDAAIATKANTSGMVTVYSGSSTPSNSLGSNGDIYIKTDVSA